ETCARTVVASRPRSAMRCLARPSRARIMLQRQQQVAAENWLQQGAAISVSASRRTFSCAAVSWIDLSKASRRSVSARSPVKAGVEPGFAVDAAGALPRAEGGALPLAPAA